MSGSWQVSVERPEERAYNGMKMRTRQGLSRVMKQGKTSEARLELMQRARENFILFEQAVYVPEGQNVFIVRKGLTEEYERFGIAPKEGERILQQLATPSAEIVDDYNREWGCYIAPWNSSLSTMRRRELIELRDYFEALVPDPQCSVELLYAFAQSMLADPVIVLNSPLVSMFRNRLWDEGHHWFDWYDALNDSAAFRRRAGLDS